MNVAIDWRRLHDFQDDATCKGASKALLRVMWPDDPDLGPARTLGSEMYREETPEWKSAPEGVQLLMLVQEK